MCMEHRIARLQMVAHSHVCSQPALHRKGATRTWFTQTSAVYYTHLLTKVFLVLLLAPVWHFSWFGRQKACCIFLHIWRNFQKVHQLTIGRSDGKGTRALPLSTTWCINLCLSYPSSMYPGPPILRQMRGLKQE